MRNSFKRRIKLGMITAVAHINYNENYGNDESNQTNQIKSNQTKIRKG